MMHVLIKTHSIEKPDIGKRRSALVSLHPFFSL